MKRFTDAGRQSVASGNLYAGLSLALMIPDICASVEDPGPGKSQARYVRWCRQWVEPKFTGHPGGRPHVFVSAEDCYQLRCSLIHSGSAEIDPNKVRELKRFEFFDQTVGTHLNWFGKVTINGVECGNFLQLKAADFSETMFKAGDEWENAVANNAEIQQEKAKLLVIRSKGFAVGGPGGIVFG